MKRRLFTVFAAISLFAGAGCYTYTPVPVRVVDDSAHQPIEGARVTVVCDADPVVWLPRARAFAGVTDHDGAVTVRRANKVPLTLRANASGYEDYRDWYFDSREPGPDGRVLVAMQRKQSPAGAP